MDLVNNYNQIKDSIVRIKSYKKGFLTNFFLSEEKCELLIKNELLYIFSFDKVCFILYSENHFYHLYYISPNLDFLKISLSQLIKCFPEHVFVVDIIANHDSIEDTISVFYLNNFSLYCRLYRMSRIVGNESNLLDNRVSFATIEQGKEILYLLHLYFDIYCEQIPLLEEINNWIEKNRILVVVEEGIIIGFLIFEITGVTSYLRYWFTHPDFRERKIGSALLRRFFFESKLTKRQLFWVIENNYNAIEKYKHYGFMPEKMFDFVLIKQ